jgi:PadR family transcriptional regulator PadR
LTRLLFLLSFGRYQTNLNQPSPLPILTHTYLMPSKDRLLSQSELMVLLAVMRRAQDAYGVSVRDEIEKRTGRKMAFGVLYTILTRLEREGLLTSRDGEATPERGGRAKKYFLVTARGLRAMNATLADIDNMRPISVPGIAHA